MSIFQPKKSYDGGRKTLSPWFQTLTISISATILFIAFSLRMDQFRTLEEPISYERLTPQKLRNLGGAPEFINAGLHIDGFREFDVIKNEFQFTGSLWFEFEAGAISIETLEGFAFDRGSILYRSEPDTSLKGTRLLVRYVIRVQFNSGLAFGDFPLDDHRINLVLTHPFISPEEIIFQARSKDFTFQGNLLPYGWRDVGRSVQYGYTLAQLSESQTENIIKQPIVIFSIDIERYGARYTLAILLPILLIHFLMFFALSVDTNPSVTISLGGLTGILAYRYVIEKLSPVSGDLMLSDHFFFLFITSSMFIFLINKIDLFVHSLPITWKKISVLAIHLFTLSCSLYLLMS